MTDGVYEIISRGDSTTLSEEDTQRFDYVLNAEDKQVVLMAGFLDGQPVSIICAVEELGKNTTKIQPLYVSVTENMDLRDTKGRPPHHKLDD